MDQLPTRPDPHGMADDALFDTLEGLVVRLAEESERVLFWRSIAAAFACLSGALGIALVLQ